MKGMWTLLSYSEGPLIRYSDGVMLIDDLNPQAHLSWRVSRSDLFRLAWRCIKAAIRGG